MPQIDYVGRDEVSIQLKNVLTGKTGKKFAIQSIDGPGGIGKSSLLQHVIEKTDLTDRKYLCLKISGNEISSSGLYGAVHRMLSTAQCHANLKNSALSYFSNFAKINSIYSELQAELQVEASNYKSAKLDASNIAAIFRGATSFGKIINQSSEKSKEYVDFDKFEKFLPEVEKFLSNSETLVEEIPSFFARLGFGEKIALRNAIRQNALIPLSEALNRDLITLLSGYAKDKIHKPAHQKLEGVDRLLIIIDDYEKTKEQFENFLLSGILKHLEVAPFETVLVILGRDDINNTNPNWDRSYSSHMEPAISLKPLERKEMDELVDSLQESTKKEKDRAWSDTKGYPLLVKLWVEETKRGGRTGTLLMQFHARTTGWMNSEQKKWLNYALFLPSINQETFGQVLENKDEGRAAWEWFKMEGSVRDSEFRVNEYLRSRLEEFLLKDDPATYRYIREKVGFLQ